MKKTLSLLLMITSLVSCTKAEEPKKLPAVVGLGASKEMLDVPYGALTEKGSKELIITAQSGYREIRDSELELGRLPNVVDFSIGLSKLPGIEDVMWDFGDGKKGFGKIVSWLYVKTDRYKVTATALDANGKTIGTASVTVVAKDDRCMVADGVTGCLNPVLNSNILPATAPTWVLEHDLGDKNFSEKPKPDSWVQLRDPETVNDERSPINISVGDVVRTSGKSMIFDTGKLLSKNIDFSRSYGLGVHYGFGDGSEIPGSYYYTTFPKIFFGIGTLKVLTKEKGVRLFIKGIESQYRQYEMMKDETSQTISDLPVDTYLLVAEKNGLSKNYEFQIKNKVPATVTIDLETKK